MNVKAILSPGKFFLIGFILIASSFVLPVYFNRSTISDNKPLTIQEATADNISDSYVKRFHLSQGQRLTVEISDRYINVTNVRVMFMTLENYQNHVLLDTDPDNVPDGPGNDNIECVYSYSIYPQGSVRSDDYRLPISVKDVVYKIDFLGGDDGGETGDLISVPGDYVVVIWGENDSTFGHTQVKIDLKILIDGLGDTLRNVFFTMGWIVLLAACVITVVYIIYNKKNR